MNYFSKSFKDLDEIKELYRQLAKVFHPDCGGTHEGFLELTKQFEQAKLTFLVGFRKERLDLDLCLFKEKIWYEYIFRGGKQCEFIGISNCGFYYLFKFFRGGLLRVDYEHIYLIIDTNKIKKIYNQTLR